jgi:mRNA-degrading endonuclease RelE of RelBE toxin-antitoxin system
LAGNLRILYSVDDVIRIIDILNIGPRGDIYKR